MKKTIATISLAISVFSCFAATHNVSSVAEIRAILSGLAKNDVILIAENTYSLTEPLEFPVEVSLIGDTDDPSKVCFDGGGATRGLIFRKSSNLKNVTIRNFYREMTSADLTSGGKTPNVASVSQTDYPGAGVLFSYGQSAVISNCVFKNCRNASGYGGALALPGAAKIYDCVFDGNTAAYGGAVYIGRDSALTTAAFHNTLFTNNTATTDGGSVIAHKNATILTVNCDVYCNSARYGGFFAGTQGGDSGSSMYATNTVFVANTATAAGGACSFWRGGVQIFFNCGFTNNTAVTAGGAIEKGSQKGCKANIREIAQCAFRDNTAGVGGAVYMYNPTNGIEKLVRCTFEGNKATTSSEENDACGGGAVLGAVRYMDSCIFKDNTATRHGGAWQVVGELDETFGPMTVTNTVFYGNGVERESHIYYMGGGAVAFGYKYNEVFTSVENVNFYDSIFVSNYVTNGDNDSRYCYGGAVFSPAGSGFHGCAFSNNFCYGTATLYSNAANENGIENTIFSGNTNYCGGALTIEWCPTNAWNRIEDCIFEDNVSFSTAADRGGAALVHQQGCLAMTNCVFKNNLSEQNGGAVYIGSSYTAQASNTNPYKDKSLPQFAFEIALDRCRFKGNSTQLHGGALVLSKDCEIPGIRGSVRNCLFEENVAGIADNGTAYTAGAVLIDENTAVGIENCTFVKNKVIPNYSNGLKYTVGGAIAINSEIAGLTNCLFVGNSAATNSYKSSSVGAIYPWKFENIFSESETVYLNIAYCIEARHPDFPERDRTRFDENSPIFNENTYPAGRCLVNGINGNIIGVEMRFTDYENGNYSPKSRSAAVDKGLSLAWMAGTADFTGDVKHNPRVYGTSVDIGCFEHIPEMGFTVIVR